MTVQDWKMMSTASTYERLVWLQNIASHLDRDCPACPLAPVHSAKTASTKKVT